MARSLWDGQLALVYQGLTVLVLALKSPHPGKTLCLGQTGWLGTLTGCIRVQTLPAQGMRVQP